MNDLLRVKLPLGHNSRKGQVGPSVLPAAQSVRAEKIVAIINQLEEQVAFWKEQTVIDNALLSIEYIRVVAKSNRIRQLLSYGSKDINDHIKGAKFVGDEKAKRHVITYYVSISAIIKSIDDLKIVAGIINSNYNGTIKCSDIESINKATSKEWSHPEISKSTFVNLVVDCFYIRNIYTPGPDKHIKGSNIVTIYNTGFAVKDKLNELGANGEVTYTYDATNETWTGTGADTNTYNRAEFTTLLGGTTGNTFGSADNLTFKVSAYTPATPAVDAADAKDATFTYNGKDASKTNIMTRADAPLVYDAVGNMTTLSISTVSAKRDIAGALTVKLHVGADATTNNQISINLEAMSAKGLGVNGIKINGEDDTNARDAIETIKEALQKVSDQRSTLGAAQNRLEHTIANLDNVVENTTSAESRIRDTDIASEMVTYSKNHILAQAGQSMLAQANQSTQGALSLLG